ncbi:ABATE domain-containing protein [Candidatus Bathyarchaeota archaeon]|nr:ABATE domain-containing protein [Candidatus Bathyarchaeota archaeon]
MSSEQAEEPKPVGGAPCLDFANTVSWRGRDHPEESLSDYIDLIEWSRATGVLDDAETEELLRQGALSPQQAESVYLRGIEFREAIYRVFRAECDDAEPTEADLETLNQVLSEALSRKRLGIIEGVYSMQYDSRPLEYVLWKLAASASELLTSEDVDRVKRCASDECGWLFLDMSRNRSRRWCSMESCGNRMKARRHYRLTRDESK